MPSTKIEICEFAYQQGWDARERGESEDDCPYKTKLMKESWLDGWDAHRICTEGEGE